MGILRSRRAFALCVASLLVVTSCGGGDGDRSRNVETIAATACTKAGATKTVAKVNYVCGKATTGKVWFAVVGKLSTKGAKACKPVGKVDVATSRVCATVKKSKVWLKVAPMPVAGLAADASTTIPPTPTTAQATPTTNAPTSASASASEVERALAPPPAPTTVDELVAKFEPRPVEAQAVPLAPTSLTASGGELTVANGANFATPFTVGVLDQNGDALAAAGHTVVATSSRPDVTLTNAVAVTDNDGVATFGKLRVDGVAGDVDIVFSANFGSSVSKTAKLTAGVGVRLAVMNNVGVVAVNRPMQVAPKVGVLDKDDNLAAAIGSVITAKYNGKTLSETAIAADGYATFTGLKVPQTLVKTGVTTVSIVYEAPEAAKVRSATQSVDLIAGTPAGLEIAQASTTSSAQSGLPLPNQPALRLVDDEGNPVGKAGVEVFVELVSFDERFSELKGTTTVTTDDDGIARFTDLAINGATGSYQLLFASRDFGAVVLSERLTLAAGLPSKVIVTRTTEVFRSGAPVESAFDLAATDVWGNVVTTYAGPVEISATSAIDIGMPTGSKFTAGLLVIENVILKGAAGELTLTFGSGALETASADIVLGAGDPVKIEILSKPGTVTAGTSFTQPLAVRLRDDADNVVGVANRPIKLNVSGATSTEETALTTADGIATFSINSLTKAGNTTFTYVDQVNDKVQATDVVTVLAGSPATISMTDAKVNAQSGVALSSQPSVQLIDGYGNPSRRAGVVVTASINIGVMGGRVTGATATSDETGKATFSALMVIGKVGGYLLKFRPTGGVAGGSLSVTLTFGPPASIELVRQPAGAVNREALTTQPIVELLDSAGNPSKTPDVVITATLDSSRINATTNSDGRATFSGLTPSGQVGARQIAFLGSGIGAKSSAIFVMQAGAVASIVAVYPRLWRAQAGAISEVLVYDADRNCTSTSPQITVETVSSTGTTWLSGPIAANNVSCTASFGLTTVSSSNASATLRYVVAGLNISTSAVVSFNKALDVGDRGPAGGMIIAKESSVPSNATIYPALSAGGRFVEAAPPNWLSLSVGKTGGGDPFMQWSTRALPTSTSVVNYSSNLFAAVNANAYLSYLAKLPIPLTPQDSSAIEQVASLLVFEKDDWLLPTAGEMGIMLELGAEDNSILQLQLDKLPSDRSGKYWSSTINYDVSPRLPVAMTASGGVNDWSAAESASSWLRVRPIRYFG